MILAQNHPRRQSTFYQPPYQNISTAIAQPQSQPHHQLQQDWSQSSTPPQQDFYNHDPTSDIFSFGTDQSNPYDFQQNNLRIRVQQELMQSERPNSWLSNGQLTPTSASTRARHHRESSLSSLGSAGPSSPYTANTSNPHVALSTDPVEIYYELHDQGQYHSNTKPLTPAPTPSQEHFLTPQYPRYNLQNLQDFNHRIDFSHLTAMSNDGLSRKPVIGDVELMPAAEFSHSGRPSMVSVASRDSPSPPPTYEDERQKTEYRSTMPKLDRTMTDIYQDELYNPTFQITTAPPSRALNSPVMISQPVNDIFSQRLQAANSQHLSSLSQTPLAIPSRELSPFRQGSPLAPAGNHFQVHNLPNMRLGTASQMREQQKAENDAMALQQQLERTSPERSTPKTISPKDVDLVYHENDEDANMPLFPPQKQTSPKYCQPVHQSTSVNETCDLDDNASQQSYGSMATTRRESSSAYSTSSQNTQQGSNFNFAPPAVPGCIQQVPQQYPFISQTRRQPRNITNVTDEFSASLTSMESSCSDYAPETADIQRPSGVSADTGTYTCTYHNCTLRFDTPAKLQRHKREGHRQSASILGDQSMASSAWNSQAGPHKCERINPSTGKPCNTIFSRPYDLTRHEDTIHNARKQKVRCHLCTEEKTFSRNDALTRHMRVVHPDVDYPYGKRRRGTHN